MPRIRFIRDVPNETGDGKLYAAGFEADTSHATAQKWIRSGAAIDTAAHAPVDAAAEVRPSMDKAARRRAASKAQDSEVPPEVDNDQNPDA